MDSQPPAAPITRWQAARYLKPGSNSSLGSRSGAAANTTARSSRDWVAALTQALAQRKVFPSPTDNSSSSTPAINPLSAASPSAAALAALSAPSIPALNTPTTTAVNFPRPAGDNGRGIHWIPTVHSSKEVVDKYVNEAAAMNVKWAVVLNDGVNIGDNDYLVKRLVEKGIMPVMRVYTSGLVPVTGDLGALVKHYKAMGVSYYQLYNEPNLAAENPDGKPSVQRYLDVWLPAARKVVEAGGLPGFGALSPQGEANDLQFLQQALQGVKARGAGGLLDSTWLSMHNYAAGQDINDKSGFARFKEYASVMERTLGRTLPIIGTEGGVYITKDVSESRQVQLVTDSYKYMARQREPYLLAYSYWVIANEAGGGNDGEYSHQALFRGDGSVSPIVNALRGMA